MKKPKVYSKSRRRSCLLGRSTSAVAALCIILLAAPTSFSADFDAWSVRLPISFGNYSKPETLTNFPTLVVLSTDITDFTYDDFASPNGYDLRFSDSTETNELSYEIEEWNTSGESFIWVRVPLLNSSTVIYAYWSNPAATTPPSSRARTNAEAAIQRRRVSSAARRS